MPISWRDGCKKGQKLFLTYYVHILNCCLHVNAKKKKVSFVNEITDPAMEKMHYLHSILEQIGNTPLLRLNRVANDVQPLVLVKMEMFNPGGSVKDRIGPGLD